MNLHWPRLLILYAIYATSSALLAQQGPTMEITFTNFLAEYDNYHPGPERVFRYTIRNTSTPSATNNLFAISLPCGIDAGLFYVWPDDFPFEWVGESLYGGQFTCLANTNHPIPPGGTITFEVRADSLAIRPGYVTAFAVGESSANAFAPVLVDAPAPPYPPPTLTRLTLSTNTATLLAENLRWNYSYTLEQSSNLFGWTNALTFWSVTGLTQMISLPLLTNAPAQFFRLRSP